MSSSVGDLAPESYCLAPRIINGTIKSWVCSWYNIYQLAIWPLIPPTPTYS